MVSRPLGKNDGTLDLLNRSLNSLTFSNTHEEMTGFPFSHWLTGSFKSDCPLGKRGNENPWSAFLHLAPIQIIVSPFISSFPFISGYGILLYFMYLCKLLLQNEVRYDYIISTSSSKSMCFNYKQQYKLETKLQASCKRCKYEKLKFC